jgi:hypothetical protein
VVLLYVLPFIFGSVWMNNFEKLKNIIHKIKIIAPYDYHADNTTLRENKK